MVADARVAALVAAWQDADRAHVLDGADRRGIERSDGARALIVERAISSAPLHEWFTAWLRYGRALAEEDVTTTLVDATTGSLATVLPEVAALPAGGAPLLEGFLSVVRERERAAADRAWEPPRCVVQTRHDEAAVCLPPFEDREQLADWAEDVARALAKRGVRTVICEEPGPARDELGGALAARGIVVRDGQRSGMETPPRPAPGRRGFWPFR